MTVEEMREQAETQKAKALETITKAQLGVGDPSVAYGLAATAADWQMTAEICERLERMQRSFLAMAQALKGIPLKKEMN